MRAIAIFSLGGMVLIGFLLWMLVKSCESLRKEEVRKYETPDTTIVYKNGKYDTTITIKQAPSWLK